MTEEEATAAISELLREVRLLRIDFLRVGAERIEGSEAVPEGLSFPMQVNAAIGRVQPDQLAFRVTVDVDRPDVVASAEVAVLYGVNDSNLWDDPTAQRVFGGRIAVPAAIPFVRAKLREVTTDMGVLPVLLGMYEPRPLDAVPAAAEDAGSTN
jgi:hypothetical protein